MHESTAFRDQDLNVRSLNKETALHQTFCKCYQNQVLISYIFPFNKDNEAFQQLKNKTSFCQPRATLWIKYVFFFCLLKSNKKPYLTKLSFQIQKHESHTEQKKRALAIALIQLRSSTKSTESLNQ